MTLMPQTSFSSIGRDDFVGQRELEIGLGREDLLGFGLVLGHRDFRLGRRLLAALGQDRRSAARG